MKKILLIEDNTGVRETTAEILTLAGYDVVQAVNGPQGVAAARRARPDLILCDVMMPELDGYGVLHILRQDAATTAIPFVFLTAKNKNEDFRRGMNAGAADYLTKPFGAEALLQAVELRLRKNLGPAAPPAPLTLPPEPGLAELHALLADEQRLTFYKRKEVLFREGNFPTCLYFVCEGKVKVFKTDAGGNEYVTDLNETGEYVGLLSVLENTAYTKSAVTVEDSAICCIPTQEFRGLLTQLPAVAQLLLTRLARKLLMQEERLLSLAYHSVRKRLAEALLAYQQRLNPTESAAPGVLHISRDELAGTVGASRETISRALGELRAARLVEVNGASITILDAEKLRRLRA